MVGMGLVVSKFLGSKSMKIFYVLGTTCSGKTTLIELAQQRFPETIGVIEVGKALRQKYPPSYFDGQGAPEKTELEALEIFESQLQANRHKRVVFVSGQPRRISQIQPTIGTYGGEVLLLYADDEVLEQRAKRRTGDNQELSLQRMKNDKMQIFDVLVRLQGRELRTFDTTTNSPEEILDCLMSEFDVWQSHHFRLPTGEVHVANN